MTDENTKQPEGNETHSMNLLQSIKGIVEAAKAEAPKNFKPKRIFLPSCFNVDGVEVVFTEEGDKAGIYYEMDITAAR